MIVLLFVKKINFFSNSIGEDDPRIPGIRVSTS